MLLKQTQQMFMTLITTTTTNVHDTNNNYNNKCTNKRTIIIIWHSQHYITRMNGISYKNTSKNSRHSTTQYHSMQARLCYKNRYVLMGKVFKTCKKYVQNNTTQWLHNTIGGYRTGIITRVLVTSLSGWFREKSVSFRVY